MATTGNEILPRWTMADVCKYLGITCHTGYIWAGEGRLPMYRIGKRWLFDPEDIDKLKKLRVS